MFAGLEISIYKPFDLGSRIKLENGQSGIGEALNENGIELTYDCTNVILRDDL
ncbi:hypothetical protein [Butyrivibrio sp. INlla16]|uniref:hypothetical protein n=1 Tax=Butyrivibrio sp. INlla16 TaxID=1520807 RepID=UPI001113E8C3|nr:hypothetical protein [Butyrivibrio sp. INlla16]